MINKNILGLGGGIDDSKTAKSAATASSFGSFSSGLSGKSGGRAQTRSDDGASAHSGGSGESRLSTASFGLASLTSDNNHFNTIAKAQKKKAMERVCAMCSACAQGKIDSLRKLLGGDRLTTDGDYDLRTPLHLAASEGRLICVEFLVERMDQVFLSPVDRFGGTPLSDAVRHKHDKVANFLRNLNAKMPEDTDRAGQLCSAAAKNDLSQLKRIVDMRFDPNLGDYDDRTAFHLAASNGNLEICAYLQSMWADLNPVDRWGGTPLADAIRHEHKEVAEFLRRNGGRLPANMDVAGMMCQAASLGNIELLQTFFTNGVNLNEGDYDSRTALHLACSSNQLAVVDFLLKNCEGSVDVNPVDRLGNTPLDDCDREKFDWMAIIIKKHGGVTNGDTSLVEKVRELAAASDNRVKEKTEELEKAERLDRSNVDIVVILKDSIEFMNKAVPRLRTELDSLLHAMQSRNKRVLSRKIIKRTRNPTLDELVDFFATSFFGFMQEHQKINELKAYVAIRNVMSEGHSTSKMCVIVRGFADTYLAHESGSKISASPSDKEDLLESLVKLENESLALPNNGLAVALEHAELGGKIFGVLSKIKVSIETQLKEAVGKYYGAPDYFAASRSRLSQAWRCLVVARSMYERTFRLLKKIDKLKELTNTTNTERKGDWNKKREGERERDMGGEAEKGEEERMKLLEDIRGAFKESITSADLRQSLAAQSGELSLMFRRIETVAIRAGSMVKENFAAHQHKMNILDSQKSKDVDRKGGIVKGLGN